MRIFIFLIVVFFSPPALAAESLIGGHNSKQPIQIDADSLEVMQKEKTAIFSGKVVAKQGKITLKADRMKVFYGQNYEKKNSITKIEVTGNVVMTSPEENAKGSEGIYDTVKNLLTLSGDVVLTKGNNIIRGSLLTVDMTNGKSQIVKSPNSPDGGRVRGLFTPEGGN